MLFLMNRDEIIAVFEKKFSDTGKLAETQKQRKPQRISVLSPGKMRLQ